jgi:hypothetical protein
MTKPADKKTENEFDKGLQDDREWSTDGWGNSRKGIAGDSVSSAHDRSQDRIIEGHEGRFKNDEERIAEGAKQIDELKQIVAMTNVPSEDPTPPGQSPEQRLRIHVPNPRTTISMGKKAVAGAARKDDKGEPNYDGFGLSTTAHAFVDVKKSMTLQSQESAALQSDANLAMGAVENVAIGSGKALIASGGAGVFICGGAPNVFPPTTRSDGLDPGDPKWVSKISGAASGLNVLTAGIDAVMGIGLTAHTLLKKQNGARGFRLLSYAKWAATIAGAVDGVAAALNATSGIGSLADWNSWQFNNSFLGGTTVYGTAGVLIASPLATDLYSLGGATIASAGAVGIMAGVEAQLIGNLDVDVSALKGELHLHAKKSAELGCPGGVNVASTEGAVAVMGKAVRIGHIEELGKQQPTHSVQLASTEATSVSSKGTTTLTGSVDTYVHGEERVGISGTHIEVDAVHVSSLSEHATVVGTTQVSLTSGSSTVVLDRESVTIGCHENAADITNTEKEITKLLDGQQRLLKEMLPRFRDKQLNGAIVRAEIRKDHMEHFYRLQNKIVDLEAKVAKLKGDKNCIRITKNGIEITHKGMKFELDDSKVKFSNMLEIKRS